MGSNTINKCINNNRRLFTHRALCWSHPFHGRNSGKETFKKKGFSLCRRNSSILRFIDNRPFAIMALLFRIHSTRITYSICMSSFSKDCIRHTRIYGATKNLASFWFDYVGIFMVIISFYSNYTRILSFIHGHTSNRCTHYRSFHVDPIHEDGHTRP